MSTLASSKLIKAMIISKATSRDLSQASSKYQKLMKHVLWIWNENFYPTFNGTQKPRRFMVLRAHIEKNYTVNINKKIAELEIINDSTPNETV